LGTPVFLFELRHLDRKAVGTSPFKELKDKELKERFRTLLSRESAPGRYGNH
jgi:hypothetical protein